MNPNRRQALAMGVGLAALALPKLAEASDPLLPLKDLPPEVLAKIMEARKSILNTVGMENGQIVSGCSSFMLEETKEVGGKVHRVLMSARHCTGNAETYVVHNGVLRKLPEPILSDRADVAMYLLKGDHPDIKGIPLGTNPVVGDEVYLMEPEGLRKGDVVEQGDAAVRMDEKGHPPIRTTVERQTEASFFGEKDKGGMFTTEHMQVPGASGSPVIGLEDGILKVRGLFRAYYFGNKHTADGQDTLTDIDGVATNVSEVRHLLEK